MDRSSQYILMCEKADEIQALWPKTHGDFFLGECGKIECWISHIHKKKRIKKGFDVNICGGVIHLTRYIWLPRFDQLIELAQMPGRRYEKTTQDFFHWSKTPYDRLPGAPKDIFDSLEQIWLAYVMEKKFRKKWDTCQWSFFSLWNRS